jgi:catechol 2,3-dioxygenase-like lactoylglutathione lyase family enzyme
MQLDHVNIVVADLPRMTAFYRDALGLVVSKEVTIQGDWIDRTVGLGGVVADVVYLDAAAGPRVELIRYRAPHGSRPAGLEQGHTPGLRHMAFRVDDIDAAVARLAAAGVKFVSPVQRVPDTQVTYAGGIRKRLVYFHDPEGNLLELCEYK